MGFPCGQVSGCPSNLGLNKNITFEKTQESIERSQKIRKEINQLNAEMCELMDWDYTPPRGFTNPFAKGEDEEKRGGKKAASTAQS